MLLRKLNFISRMTEPMRPTKPKVVATRRSDVFVGDVSQSNRYKFVPVKQVTSRVRCCARRSPDKTVLVKMLSVPELGEVETCS